MYEFRLSRLAGSVVAAGLIAASLCLAGCSEWDDSTQEHSAVAKFQRRTDVSPSSAGKAEALDEDLLAGRDALIKAAEELKLFGGQATRDAIVDGLAESVTITQTDLGNVELVGVRVTHADPAMAAGLANVLVTNYINAVSERITTPLTASRNSLLKQVSDAKARLAELNKQRLEFDAAPAGAKPASVAALQKDIQRLTTDIKTLQSRYTAAQTDLEVEDAKRRTHLAAVQPAEAPPVCSAPGGG